MLFELHEVMLQLRKMGVKAMHPNDGWVRRDSDIPYEIVMQYPDFYDDPTVGDKIALHGWQDDVKGKQCLIFCEITAMWSCLICLDRTKITMSLKPVGDRFSYDDLGKLEAVPSERWQRKCQSVMKKRESSMRR